MKLSECLDEVLKKASSYTRNQGKILYYDKAISKLKGKKIDTIYHIYSKCSDNNNIYSCHIKLSLINKELSGSCSCKEYLEFTKVKKDYICKHIVGTSYVFNELLHNKILNSNSEKKEIEKRKFNLDIVVANEIVDGKEMFSIKLKVGIDTLFQVQKLKQFIKSRYINKRIVISSSLSYRGSRDYFDEYNKKILDNMDTLIDKKVILCKNEVLNKLYIEKDKLQEFLVYIPEVKSITFTYNHMTYLSSIKRQNLNLGVNVKLQKNILTLESKKRLPIELNNKCNIFLFNRDIYIPYKDELESFIHIYKCIKSNNIIEYKNPNKEILELAKILLKFTDDITFNEGAKNILMRKLKNKIILGRENNKLYCNVKVDCINRYVNILSGDLVKNIVRDKKREEILMMQLETIGFIKRNNKFVFLGNEEEEFLLLNEKINLLKEIGEVSYYDSFYKVNILKGDNINAYIVYKNGYHFKYDIDGVEHSEWKDIYISFKSNKKYYKTKKNDYLDLKDENVVKILNIMDSLGFNENYPLEDLYINNNKLDYLEKIIGNEKNLIGGEEVLHKALKNIKSNDISYIDGFKGTLRRYQLLGVNFFNNLSKIQVGGILADEMGLGKTVQVISFLLTKKNSNNIIIVPTSLLYNWKNEFEKFAPTLKVQVVNGDSKRRKTQIENYNEFDVLITTYGVLKSDIDIHRNNIYDYCIIDEAQNIKNSKAQVTKAIKAINSKIRFALTGTPIENNLLELWSIFDFILPGYLKDEVEFKNKYIDNKDHELQNLKLLIDSFILRRLKSDVIKELPNKEEKIEIVKMSVDESNIYKSYVKEIKEKLRESSDRLTIFSYLTKLRLLAIDPKLVIEDYSLESSKFNCAKDMIKDKVSKDKKILVFSQFTKVLKSFRDVLNSENIDSIYLDGATSAKERSNLVDEFNLGNSKVFLISLKAGGTGLNLTSAHTVIHLDPWWNPAVEDQATDRAHRIGQKNIVQVYKFITKDTIEEKMIKIQEEKREIINEILSTEKDNYKLIIQMSNEELIELFQ